MREFNYKKFITAEWDSEILSYIGKIHEYKGKQEFYLKQKPQELNRLIDIAKIQSTESSNKIEGVVTTSTRIHKLLSEKTSPKNRDESEILGYRDVLNTIHENYDFIPIRPNYILQLHRDLYKYSTANGGIFKSVQNYINARTSNGGEYVLFRPLDPFETPTAVDMICKNYEEISNSEKLDELLLLPIFISDFLCIHPFIDGNGRMSRLLTTLILYKHGYFVGKYISLEKIIEETKISYYEALQETSKDWHDDKNSYNPFIKYLLKIILRAYKELDERIILIEDKLSAYDMVKKVVESTLGTFTKKEIAEKCPKIGNSSVEAALKKLKDEKIINALGVGRSTKYSKNICRDGVIDKDDENFIREFVREVQR